MGKLIDLSGQKYGRLTVLHRGRNIAGRVAWRCLCDCGSEVTVSSNCLRTGNTRSCGCLQREVVVRHNQTDDFSTHAHNVKHGYNGSPTYVSWAAMRCRCNNPAHHAWERYGGRGITVCIRWESFENFLADMGERPAGTTIDRINNDGDYEPGNCRWATQKEQVENRRRIEEMLADLIEQECGLSAKIDARFTDGRRWRADLLFPEQRLVVEIQGGFHISQARLRMDAEKYNVLTKMGFRVLVYPAGSVLTFKRRYRILKQIISCLAGEGETEEDYHTLTGD